MELSNASPRCVRLTKFGSIPRVEEDLPKFLWAPAVLLPNASPVVVLARTHL